MTNRLKIVTTGVIAVLTASGAIAAPVIVGNGGSGTANGVVTAPPADGPGYFYVSTSGGVGGVGQIPGAGGTNGSTYTTDSFTAVAGGQLTFYFNFVTSDGAGFSDYAWSALVPTSGPLTYLFSARTTPTGNTVPGFGLPGLASVLTPATTPIIPGGPAWDKLGGSSGRCYSSGCGYTGWVKSTYTVVTPGTYSLAFGVTNSIDSQFDTGLAFTTAFIDGTPINPGPGVPEPGTWSLLIAGFGLVGVAARRRRTAIAA